MVQCGLQLVLVLMLKKTKCKVLVGIALGFIKHLACEFSLAVGNALGSYISLSVFHVSVFTDWHI